MLAEPPSHPLLPPRPLSRTRSTAPSACKSPLRVASSPDLIHSWMDDSTDFALPFVVAPSLPPSVPAMTDVLLRVGEGLLCGGRPQPIADGMGGAYCLAIPNGLKAAVFKPSDEEPCAPHNPKGLQGSLGDPSLKPGVLSGEQAVREVAARCLDHVGLAGVPRTTLVTLAARFFGGAGGPKEGSLQEFIAHDGVAGDYGPAQFDTLQVQAIALLDMRLMNTDRHDGNILVSRSGSGLVLTPIDHGCCLPDTPRVSEVEWCHLEWPQLAEPLHPKLREAVLSLDVDADARVLASLGVRPACITTMRLATTFVKMCVRDCPEMTLRDIARGMVRADLTEDSRPSPLEQMASRAEGKGEGAFEKEVALFLTPRSGKRRASASFG